MIRFLSEHVDIVREVHPASSAGGSMALLLAEVSEDEVREAREYAEGAARDRVSVRLPWHPEELRARFGHRWTVVIQRLVEMRVMRTRRGCPKSRPCTLTRCPYNDGGACGLDLEGEPPAPKQVTASLRKLRVRLAEKRGQP